MDETLRTTLRELLRRGAEPNPVLDALVRDYQRFHLVLALVGGLFLVLLLVAAALLWRGWQRARAQRDPARRFERRAYAALALLATVCSLMLGVVVAANASTAISPRQGFIGSVALLGSPAPGTRDAAVQASVLEWLDGGDPAQVPPSLQRRIDDRLAWQRPKAVVVSALLVVVAGAGLLAWRALVRRSRASGGRTSARDVPLLLAGWTSTAVCLLLVLMVMGNTQGSIAPLSLTLFRG
jgi:hypothetical protein